MLWFLSYQGFSQQSFNYQAAIRDAEGNPITNQAIGVQITVLQGNATGTSVYEETHMVISNAQGIIALVIGVGDTLDSFTAIDWGTQDYWLQVAVDVQGGTNYTVMGASQLQSVPYANYATNGPDADPTNEIELPAGGTNGQVLVTDGVGNYSWVNDKVDDADADATNEIELPTGGTNGQVLVTDGSGNYSWVTDNVNDADADPTNEIELPTGGTNGQVLVTDGAGNYSWVTDNVNDADADPTNEIELPTGGTNGQVLVTDGSGNYSWVTDNVNDADADPTNEIELPTGGTNGQVLVTDGSGNYSWVTDKVDDGDTDATNEIELPTGGTSGQILVTDGSGNYSWVTDKVDDGDTDATNEIELPTGGNNGQVLSTDGSGNYSWVTDTQGAFSTTNNITSNAPGTIATDDFVFGSTQLDNDTSTTDDDNRMFFDKEKGAFRVGRAFSNQWDDANVLRYTIAMGNSSMAKGIYSVAIGDRNTANFDTSIVLGDRNTTDAPNSYALGSNLITNSPIQTSLGINNTGYSPSSPNSFTEPTNRLLVVGNGTTNTNRSDALVILRNGNTTLNGELTIDGDNQGAGTSYTLPAQDGTINQVMSTDGTGTVSWVDVPTSTFSTIANVTSNTNGDITTDDFVFGSTQLDNDPLTTDDNAKLFFDKSKAAFRVGRLKDLDPTDPTDNEPGDQWNDANVGDGSIALGEGSIVAAKNAIAIGDNNTIDDRSANSKVIGDRNNITNSVISYAFGDGNTLTNGGSMAFGFSNTSSGLGAIAMGFVTHAGSYGQTSIGLNSTVADGTKDSYQATDRLFVIGNGISALQRRDALVMLKNGNTTLNGSLTIDGDNNGAGRGYTLPAQDGTANQVMTTNGTGSISWTTLSGGGNPGAFSTASNVTSNTSGAIATDDFVFGSTQLDNDTSTTDDDRRFFFDKSKGAFRAGIAFGSDWDESKLGNYSIALGRGNEATANASFAAGESNISSGSSSIAMGEGNEATNIAAIAMGNYSKASGDSSIALGDGSNASAQDAVAIGDGNTASAIQSVAIGNRVTSDSYGQVSLGYNNTPVTGNATQSIVTDRLFVLGNGTAASKSDALTILKNGNTTLNGSLTIDGDNQGTGASYTLPAQDGTANQIMRTDGSGNVSWSDIPSQSDSDWLKVDNTQSKSISDNIYTQGNVGIGTTILEDQLHIKSIGNGTRVRVENSSNGWAGLLAKNSISEIFVGIQGAFDTNPGEFHIYDNTATERRLVIDNNGNMGIAEDNPTAKLHINGDIKIVDGTQGLGKILTSDANGLASWTDAPSGNTTLPAGGTNGQILRTDGGGNYSWVTDAVNDADNDPTNEIELPSGGAANSLLTTDGSGNRSWTSDVSASTVTTPALTVTNLPSFSADLSGTLVLSGAGNFFQVPTWRTNDATLTNLHDSGNHFDEASGTFTAPVNGLYFFSAQVRFDGVNSGDFRLLLGIQNKLSLDNGMHAITKGDAGTDFHTLTVSGVMRLNAGEKVNVNVQSSADTSWSLHSESGFSGYLISRF